MARMGWLYGDYRYRMDTVSIRYEYGMNTVGVGHLN